MTVPAIQQPPEADDAFAQDAYLTYTIPLATKFDLEKAIKSRKGSIQKFFEAIPDRDWLFFDETVDVYFILRAPYLSEHDLRAYISRLNIVLETQVSNTHTSDREGLAAVEVIYNGSVGPDDEPFVVIDEPEEEGEVNGNEGGEDAAQGRYAYAVWKLPVFLGRPRMRLQGPTVSFAAVASLQPAENITDRRKNGYLESRAPLALNLLQSFGNDPALGGVRPKLSAQRVSRVAPATNTRDQQRPIPGKKAIIRRIFPAVHTRVRFARTNTAPASPSIIALLEVDFTPFFDCEALLSSIDLRLPSGVVTDLNKEAPGLALPLSCVAHDHITFMYHLSPHQHELNAPIPGGPPSPTPSRDLDITVTIDALVEPGICTPSLTMSWMTTIDFTLPVNPGFGNTLTNPTLNRLHRPSQLSIDGIASLTAPQVARPDALPSLEATARNTETTIPDFGITMTFSAPDHPVFAGDEFSWTVLVVNRTSPNASTNPNPAAASGPPPPRKLALVVIPKRRRNDLRVLRPPSSHTTAGGRGKAGPVDEVADAVLDENIVHAMQRSSLVDGVDVVCLSADVRVGPLAPGACHAVELKFVALRGGEDGKGDEDGEGGLVLGGVEAVRVVDLATQEHVDVRELPVVVVRSGKKGRSESSEEEEDDDDEADEQR